MPTTILRRGAVASGLVALLLAALGGLAFACTPIAVISTDREAAPPGTLVNVAGTGFASSSQVVAGLYRGTSKTPIQSLFSGSPQPNGVVVFSFTVPKAAPGDYVVSTRSTVKGVEYRQSASLKIEVARVATPTTKAATPSTAAATTAPAPTTPPPTAFPFSSATTAPPPAATVRVSPAATSEARGEVTASDILASSKSGTPGLVVLLLVVGLGAVGLAFGFALTRFLVGRR